jgi:hypothetical protein
VGKVHHFFEYPNNENFEVSIWGTLSAQPAGDKLWSFYSEQNTIKSSLVHTVLGYQMRTQITNIKDILNSNKENFKTTIASTEIKLRSLKAAHSYSENSALFYLASNVLSSNSIVSRNEGGIMASMKTNLLETIHVNVSRYSHIAI